MVKFDCAYEVIDLVKAFEMGTLPKSEWTHAAHLSVGLFFNLRYSFGEALGRMRSGVIALNEKHGVANSEISGYHETITVFWMITIRQFIESKEWSNLAELANRLITLFDNPGLMFDYYSRELLFSPEARKAHVQPDINEMYLASNVEKIRIAYDTTARLVWPVPNCA